MDVAVAWNGSHDRTVWPRGSRNRERMPRRDAQRVADALGEHGHDAHVVRADVDLLAHLQDLPREGMVFNTAYGVQGAARYTHVPALLEMAGHRYTGSGPLGHALALEKPVTKTLLADSGVPTPWWRTVAPDEQVPEPESGYPVVVKPVREAGSLGLAVANDRSGLMDAVEAVHEGFQQSAIVERYIPGCDLMVSLLGNDDPQALPPVQLRPPGDEGVPAVLTQQQKEGPGQDLEVHCPARLDGATLRRAVSYSVQAYRCLGLEDWGRVDLRVTPDGQAYVLEVNSIPGLSPRSSAPLAAEVDGMGFDGLVDHIVRTADDRWKRREERAARKRQTLRRLGEGGA